MSKYQKEIERLKELLIEEGDRHIQLARERALQNLLHPNPDHERIAREQLLRAETFKTAASLIVKWSEPQ